MDASDALEVAEKVVFLFDRKKEREVPGATITKSHLVNSSIIPHSLGS